jgi:hypothetical protein
MYNSNIYNKEIELLNGNVDILLEDIYDSIDNDQFILNEAISFMDEYKWLKPLHESVSDISDLEKDLTKLNDDSKEKETLLKKCINKLKSLYNWWYKEEPDKKFKTLRIVLKISFKLLGIILILTAPGKKLIAKHIIPYTGSNKILKKLITSKKIAYSLTSSFYMNIINTFNKIEKQNIENVNMKDIDKIIKEIDSQIDLLYNKLETCSDEDKDLLLKQKKELENVLAKLIKIKDGDK